ncbi:AI-2E family transporter [Clostridium sp. MB05]|uniref:AI-2E family transporter n=1 Tax=Clostridium sp. MB05 TaxID=3376682 RepID=UPI0039829B24
MELYKTYSKIINLVSAFIIVVLITILIKNYFQPFCIVIMMILITQPLYKFFIKGNIPKVISAILSLIIVNISIFIVIFYFGNAILGFFQKLYRNNMVEVDTFINNIKILLNFDLNKMIQTISGVFNGNMIMQGAIITGDGLVSYFLANIIDYFILVDKNKIYNLLKNLFPKEIIASFSQKIKNLKEVFKIEVKLILLSAVIITLGFKVLGIHNSIFLGSVCAVLDILPFIGTTIVFIPIIIYNIIMKKYLLVFGLISLYLLERFTREILEAKFLSSKLEIHPLMVIVSIYIGVKMFGFIGIISGPIYSIIAKDMIYSS